MLLVVLDLQELERHLGPSAAVSSRSSFPLFLTTHRQIM
jgi:hypothetical protein